MFIVIIIIIIIIITKGYTAHCWALAAFAEQLGRGISPKQELRPHSRKQKTQNKRTQNTCLEWNSNPGPQCLSGRRRFMPYNARPLSAEKTYRPTQNAQRKR
jgi:hypothetical protein